MELINRFKSREPEYDERYHDMVMSFTMEQGGRSGTATDTTSWEQGRYFTYRYETYMYAALLGLKKDYRIEIPKGSQKRKFIPLNAWKPTEIADFIIMGLLAKSEVDFTELEKMAEEDVEKELTKLKLLLEEYTNGGLDIIRAKREEDPSFFSENENCFLDLIDN
jgi:hypothetical protein